LNSKNTHKKEKI